MAQRKGRATLIGQRSQPRLGLSESNISVGTYACVWKCEGTEKAVRLVGANRVANKQDGPAKTTTRPQKSSPLARQRENETRKRWQGS